MDFGPSSVPAYCHPLKQCLEASKKEWEQASVLYWSNRVNILLIQQKDATTEQELKYTCLKNIHIRCTTYLFLTGSFFRKEIFSGQESWF